MTSIQYFCNGESVNDTNVAVFFHSFFVFFGFSNYFAFYLSFFPLLSIYFYIYLFYVDMCRGMGVLMVLVWWLDDFRELVLS